jgi:hypothetical protein
MIDVLLVVAGIAWCAAAVADSYWAWSTESFGQVLAANVAGPSRYVAIAIVFLVVSRFMRAWFSSTPTVRSDLVCPVVDLRQFWLLWPTIAMTLLVGLPALTWFTFSLVKLGLGW